MTKIPTFTCKPGCSDCCGLVPFSTAERDAAIVRFPLEQWEPFDSKSWVAVSALNTMQCPFLTAGKCDIYDVRPMVCQFFGAVDHPLLTCPHGCGPKRKLTLSQSQKMIKEVALQSDQKKPRNLSARGSLAVER